MSSIIKHGNGYKAVIRLRGECLTKQFDRKPVAQVWADEQEARINARKDFGGGMLLGALLERYHREVIEPKHTESSANSHLPRFARDLATVDIADLAADWWKDWVKSLGVKPSTALHYITQLTGALQYAEAFWKVKVDWVSQSAALKVLFKHGEIAQSTVRKRRAALAEITAIKAELGDEYNINGQRPIPMADVIDFALALGFRCGEITRITWADLDPNPRRPMLWVRDRKHPRQKKGNDKLVPLLVTKKYGLDPLAIIQRQPRTDPRIFPFSSTAVSNAWRRVARLARVKGLRFHDLRHEAISRLFEEGYNIPEVCLVSGHESWKSLKRYTQLNPEDLHDGPAAVRAIERITLAA